MRFFIYRSILQENVLMKKTVIVTIVIGIFVYAYIFIQVLDTWIAKVIQFIHQFNPV